MKPVTNSLCIDVALAQKRMEAMASDEMMLSSQLKIVLTEALEQSRLTCGIYECGKLLEMNPEGIMMCLLPENTSNDVALHIHLTLIEAFCWENCIRVIKVDNLMNASTLLVSTDNQSTVSDESSVRCTQPVTDYNCVLIEYPSEKYSAAEEVLLDFHKFTCDMVPQPFVPFEV